ncbi:unnamed protein product [Nezara viridula]|uniref:Lipoyl-binding domain-containing protein n=1 Tax=Nezara viridula TaxID=85310 RepID=A0A9P0E6Z5_NEZVI|nr:unnamed protein product [Nezara viridula]
MDVDEDKIVIVPPFPESVAEDVGDSVSTDEVVCEIETDKTSIPVPSPGNGVIVERYVEDNSTVKAGQKLFKVQLGGGGAPSPKPTAKPAAEKAAPPPQPSAGAPAAAPPPPTKAAPPSAPPTAPPPIRPPMPVAAIKHAQAVEAAVVKVPPEDPTHEISGTRSEYRVKMNRMRQRIAQRLKEAQNVNAMLTTFNEIDMRQVLF